MVRSLDPNFEALKEICRKHHVRRLELRNSGLTTEDLGGEQEDPGFFVWFLPQDPRQEDRNFLSLLNDLEKLFARPIDLLDLESVKNEFIRKAISKSRTLIYAVEDQEES